MKIGMIDVHNSFYDGIYEVSEPIKRAYCAKHGYEFVEYISQAPLVPEDRQSNWSRVQGIICELHRFDWLFYLDTDILIMNDEIKIESFIDDKYNLIAGPLPSEGHIMTSGMLIRNCRWSYEFFLDLYAQTKFIHEPYHSPAGMDATGSPPQGGYYFEQSAFHFLYDTVPKYKQKIKLVERRHFNSETKSYKEGDFLIHFPGQIHKARLMKKMLQGGTQEMLTSAHPVNSDDFRNSLSSSYTKIHRIKNVLVRKK